MTSDDLRLAAERLAKDYATAMRRIDALRTTAAALVGPVGNADAEVLTLLVGALVSTCRASAQPLATLDVALEMIQETRVGTLAKIAEAERSRGEVS